MRTKYLKGQIVTALQEALLIGEIRNECVSYLTRSPKRVGVLSQIYWYFCSYLPKLRDGFVSAWLFEYDGLPVGYGLIREEEGKVWLSGGLREGYRDKGLGKRLFTYLVAIAKTKGLPVYLEVKTTNGRARSVYEWLGFEAVSEKKGVLTMRL